MANIKYISRGWVKGRAILLQTKYFCGYFDNNNYKYMRELLH